MILNHTPELWQAVEYVAPGKFWQIQTTNNRGSCLVIAQVERQAHHTQHNAQLLANAPAMLNALITLKGMLGDIPMPSVNNVINKAIEDATRSE